ncbi:Dihydrofolate reductase [Pseudovibrio denitrificans]|uniref:Dihydrofolate reductase n=1 Tax=Pseudovibrio denitrificans TaxID=258256 RepID=A0A1I6Y9X9_9HYPH|nr:dihydrofolate reductase family protein [Pseudovibrio denitrificans]SFT47296.1 Dihydrofolate reductase [Pseudovibrio denitrificans]
MRDLAILTFQSVDGVMQAPSHPDEDRSEGFDLGGWAQPYWMEVMELVKAEAMSLPYDFLYGRKTYDLFAAFWQTADPDDPATQAINSAQKYVVTSQQDDLGWVNTQRVHGDLPEVIGALKAMDGPLLQVHGSWRLIQQLLEHDLIDEFRLLTFPVILGKGKKLFQDGAPVRALKHIKSGHTAGGVKMDFYRRTAA